MPKMTLNKEQKKAVTHEEGSILVVAGAGTGKTRVITERIKHLIQREGIKSDEILALTFTEKAAAEMSERVGDIMPLGYEEPWINTFHSFADRILKNEGLEIGLDPTYKILSGPKQWVLLKKHIFDLGLKYFLPMGNPTKFISAILKFISRLQDENVSPEELEKIADDDRLKELTGVYKKYQELKMKNSKLDFGDLITWTIKIFEERPKILEKYQNQFKHILVDEFQDTNYAQYELVKMLFPKTSADRSLLAVGDDSQSIYKFRGAAVSNILQFMEDYPKAKMVTLTENYRSTQEILDPAYKLIQNNNPDTLETKLKISKKLTSESEGNPPKVVQLDTLENEVEYIISQIYELLAKEPEYTYRDIAILARANNHLEPFVLALRKHGLPYQLVGNRGLYDQDEVRDILALLKVIIDPADSINLYRVLNMDCLDIPQEITTKALSQARYKKIDVWEVVREETELEELVDLIKTYQDKITKISPVQFVYEIVNKVGYIGTLLENESVETQLSINNLDIFLNIVKGFEVEFRGENKELPTIVNLVDHIDMLIEAGDNPAQAEIEDVDTVNILTVHSSKGLEFSAVFMVNLIAGRFPTRNRSDPIEVPEKLIKETLPTGNEHIQEERRLFYVGMTRAKKYLYLTCAKNYGGKREAKVSGYLGEIGIKLETPEIKLKKGDQKGLFGVESGFRDPIYKKISFQPKFLSYSQVDTYKTCPLKYKYRYVLSLPTPPNHALSFGITIHDTLRDFHQMQLHQKIPLKKLNEIYEKNWHPLGYDDEKHRQVRFEAGKNLLKEYYGRHAEDTVKPVALEKSFNLYIDGVRFFGRIDRIDKIDGGVEIIDYKTGKAKEQKFVDKDDQVAFYAIAAKEALGMKPKKLTYYFVESGERISTTRTEAQLEDMKKGVGEVVKKLKGGDFKAKPGMQCEWCDFSSICPFAYKN
ncbi:ATP-dependent helicase [Patescibacteria group bacterium]